MQVMKLHMLIDAVTTSYDKFYFGDVAREIYDFFWADFADWYVKLFFHFYLIFLPFWSSQVIYFAG